MAGLLNFLGNTAGRAFKKYPIGAPVATGASLAALTGTLGNEESGWVGRNKGKVLDAFGFGTQQRSLEDRRDHQVVWEKFTNREASGDLYEKFVNSNWDEKSNIIRSYAHDTDDILWRSKEMMRIYSREQGLGDDQIDYINKQKQFHSAEDLDYSEFGKIDSSNKHLPTYKDR
jgi:hypothetical protein